ncbi:MAG TPA: NAD(P)H-binding protein [Polyangiaceae bacterium]|nr:NAD(P)H-binding protein [Polyangiaceae bacterium]
MTPTALAAPRRVFLTGGTGYLGRRLAATLVARGHAVRALARPGSETGLPAGVETVLGDALDARSYQGAVTDCDTFVHLVGVAHPSPRKAALFRSVDLASAEQALVAAGSAAIRHFVYVSVAQPAPVMRAYVEARAEAEAQIRARGLAATVLRPWYVLGPGHRWPLALLPIYWLASLIPALRAGSQRLGLVTLSAMQAALVHAVENPSSGVRVLGVPEIRRAQNWK